MIRSAVLTSLIFSTLCHADFAGMYLDSSGPVDPSGDGTLYKSHRVYALFTDSTDRVFSIVGLGQSGGIPLQFSSFDPDDPQSDPELFRECVVPCDQLSCGQTSQPVANLHGPYHSFVCLRSGDQPSDFPAFGQPIAALVNYLAFTPDVLCSGPSPVEIEGSFWTTGGIDGGYFPQDPLNGSSTGRLILIAQFTLPLNAEFEYQGNLQYNYTPPGSPNQIPGQSEFFVASTDFSGLSECTDFESFFTAFSEAVNEDPSQEWDYCGDGIFDLCQGLDSTEPPFITDCNSNGIEDYCEPDFEDLNNNGLADICEDIDCDDDGIPDPIEIEKGSPDTNQNGIPDECEPDCDGDGILDEIEIQEGSAIDLNGNGIDDECDPDCDQNGVPDFFQIEQGAFDCNLDGILDICEISENPALDLNTNTVIDSCEADCNENGTFDFVDILLEFSQDINKNSVPDECEDCDGDGIPDDLEDKADCDGNGLPDVCEVDEDCDNDGDINACDFDDDGDGIEDLCDADSCGLTGQDCDENGILDSCEEFSDCNNNGIDDRCDIQSGEEDDLNLDGIPDSCQCIADVVPNGEIGFPDLVTLLSAWGTCEAPCPSDIIADGDVGFSDLLYLLSNWGKCFNLPGGGGGTGGP